VTRRDALKTLLVALAPAPPLAKAAVATLIGTGSAGYSDTQVNNPYGLAIGPDGALYFCDLDNQRVRRLDPRSRRTSTVAGDGRKGYAGDGAEATRASLNMPHEIQFDAAGHLYIAERDNHVVRKVDGRTGIITTCAGTGEAGFSGDGGAASRAQLRQPHSIAVDRRRARLLICDIGNHRIRQVDLATGIIDTVGGTGERQPTPDGATLKGTPLNGPRTIAFDASGHLYLALREGNAIYRVDADSSTVHHLRRRPRREAGWTEGPRLVARHVVCRGHGESRDSRDRSALEHHSNGARDGAARRWSRARSDAVRALAAARRAG
jgi:DNA-binding beta-propeller fold protein YncE